ncbi:MAG: glutathione S-transferase family protein [Rhodobacteraceae bacterium]|jgi:putative glutathione S-transferase|nr:glutathione-dependent reductase [Marinovum sp.]MDA7551834.1 glutathione S-transferase family protein [Paracoccaceae bacterium]RZO36892.1 MAG: glutathione S-transferase family protein [Paracoccaceae bacterium]|tara:strand:- start:99 stop:1070 length:972 start_codon:yes stop_codon:yes gene_type:complete
MGLLQEGKWVDQWYDTKSTNGRFVRKAPQFRNWVTTDGRAGPSGKGGFKAEIGRYHLYVSLACPWAHRTLIFRALKGLEKMISVSVVHWYMAENGWTFDVGDGVAPDTVNGAQFLYQVYTQAKPDYSGRVTVPVLWDKHTKTIVSNESPEIIRMFNTAFDEVGSVQGDYYPKHLRSEIDTLNERIYTTLNNGVYRCGFATTQAAYEEAITPLFDTLDWLEDILSRKRYLTGAQITEADWRLFTTLIRFDPVYVGHFKCNIRRIADYPNLSNYLRDLYQQPGIARTVNMEHIKRHYYESHTSINPSRIVPTGPDTDFTTPHDRG